MEIIKALCTEVKYTVLFDMYTFLNYILISSQTQCLRTNKGIIPKGILLKNVKDTSFGGSFLKTLITKISDCIERCYDIGGKNFSNKIIIFPVGDVGMQVLEIMKNVYSIEPAYLVDNHKCKFSERIFDSSIFSKIDADEFAVILASTNLDIYSALRKEVQKFFPENNIMEFFSVIPEEEFFNTKIGRHCYGPICCNHPFIAQIGSFCSFAMGVDVVPNHEMNFITTHPILYEGVCYEGVEFEYKEYEITEWYLPGINPQPIVEKRGRSVIGNDVWLGRNVIITNYANIGNGVIAAAGAVITKDVPDYAVVAGVPARVIRYRYSQEQINALNKISWWDWTDDEIRERFNDFYLPVDKFINKYV